MTNGNVRDGILNKLDLVDNAAIISKGLESQVYNERANTEKDNYARDSIFNDAFNPDGSPRMTEDVFNGLREEEQNQLVEGAYNFRQRKSLADAVKDFSENPGDALRENDNYSNKLVDIAYSKEVIDNAEDDKRKVLTDSFQYSQFVQIIKDLEAGKPMDPELKQQIDKLASDGASKAMYNHMDGYSEELRKLAAQYAALVPGEITDDMRMDGTKKRRDDEKTDLEKMYGNDFETRIAEAVGGSLTSLVKSSDPKKEQVAVGLMYKAFREHDLGERDFKDVYN
jgi:hypothetical protein